MMEVVAINLQLVKPCTAQYVSLGIGKSKAFSICAICFSDILEGQRFNEIMTANGTVGNY
jgi:hypothetical protein